MTEQEAIKILKRLVLCGTCTTGPCEECERKLAKDAALSALEEIQKYRTIGTVEELQKIKEKITPSKVFVKEFLGEKYYQCPVCYWMLTHEEKYCNNCGQALDWSK